MSFKYDPAGRRIYKQSTSGTTIFVYDGPNVIETVNSTGGVVARYTQSLDTDEPFAETLSGTVSYYEQDGLGSVTSLTASNGSLAQTYTYDSFGITTTSSGSLTNSFRYTGREFDTETSLDFYRARYYDPSVGRFLSEDSLRFSSEAFNFYDYVSNNPLVFSDPSGNKKIHGKWCGPNWTGGRKETYIPSHDVLGYYAPPIDPVDSSCRNHDQCYSRCRANHPCSPGGRRICERKCDFQLVGGILGQPSNVFNPWAYIIGLGIGLDLVPPAGPNGGAEPAHPASCPSCGGSGPPPQGVH